MSESTVDTLLLLVFRSLITVLVCGIAYLAMYFTIDVKNYILVHEITPSQDVFFVDEKVGFNVNREIFRDYSGGYHVTFRDPNGRLHCTSGVVDLPYNTLERKDRYWEVGSWAAGPGGCNGQKIFGSRMEPGEYIKITCHRVYLTFFPAVEHCWDPVRFSVVDPENPPELIQRSLAPIQEQIDQLKEK